MKYYDEYRFPEVPKTMPKREMKLMISCMRAVRDTATMKNADFPDEWKRAMEVWRTTWIISPLEDLIERYEAALSTE